MDQTHPILLFDGVCNLCNSTVQFIIERDPEGLFRFASLQSEAGRRVLNAYGEVSNLETVILVDAGRIYRRSDAALRVLKHLGWPWKLALIFWPIPRFIRDFAYRQIAKRRYQFFGQRHSCMIPTPDRKQRFLLDQEAL